MSNVILYPKYQHIISHIHPKTQQVMGPGEDLLSMETEQV